VAMMFLEGSILFTIGGSFAFFAEYVTDAELPKAFSPATVLAPYLVGSINFTLGAWFGIEELLRLPRSRPNQRLRRPRIFCFTRPHHWRRIREVTSWEPIVAYPAYFVGALFFNVNCVAGYLASSPPEELAWVWLPACVGSFCFVVGGACECHRNREMIQRADCCRAAVVQSILDLLGGCLFLLAALTGAIGVDKALAHWLVDLSYLAGSLAFLGGSVAGLWMWKGEQYGLALVPEINYADDSRYVEPAEYAVHQEQLAQYGCGKSSAHQLPWLIVYLLNASASVVDVALSLQPDELGQVGWTHKIIESVLNFGLSHGIVALGSVVHHVPTKAPHSWLLRFMRVVLLVYTANSWLNVVQRVAELG